MDSLDQQIIEQIDYVSDCLSRSPNVDLYGPAPFWEALAEKHKGLIREYGFRAFKRTINFEYHQWEIRSLKNVKIRNLLRRLVESGRLPYGVLLAKMDAEAVAGIEQIQPGAYTLFMGLLWQYALLKDNLACLDICDEPRFGDPLPVTYKGRLISQDLATTSLELNRIAQHIDLSKIRKVAEIGAGYGRVPYVFIHRFPETSYSIFDIPPALVISQNYLSQTLGPQLVRKFEKCTATADVSPAPGISAYLPDQLEHFPDGYFDLVINISSFDEMESKQVDNYLALIDRKCSGWLYVKGHGKAPAWCAVSGGGITDLSYPSGWQLLFEGKDPFSDSFIERIYSLRPQLTDQ